MKKANANKGFSLVELIIVVAIMAILISVLAPTYSRYVERTRLQKDNSTIAEIANAIKIAMTDEAIRSAVSPTLPLTLSFTNAGAGNDQTINFAPATPTALQEELAVIIGETFTTESNTYNAAAATDTLELVIWNDATGGVTVGANGWFESVSSNVSGDIDTSTTPVTVPAATATTAEGKVF